MDESKPDPGKAFPPEVKAAAREAYIAAIVALKKSPQRVARKAVGVVALRTISKWACEWDADPDVMEAVRSRVQRFIRTVEYQAIDLTNDVYKLSKNEPTIHSEFGENTREVVNPAIEAKTLAARTAIGALSVLARVAEKHEEDRGIVAGKDEPTPQKASALVREKFGHVTPKVDGDDNDREPSAA